MQKIDHLIHAKWIIPCEDSHTILENHFLAIKDDKIIAIEPNKNADQYQATKTHHYSDHAITPGLINSHTHLAMNAFRGLADDLALMDWLNNHIWPAEGKWVSKDFVYDASQIAIAEMIRCGSTCFNDMYFFLNATAKAAEEAGVRAHIGMTIIDVPTAWAQTTEEYFEKSEAFYQDYKDSKVVTPTLAPHSTYTVSLESLIKVKELASKYKLKTNIHLQESAAEISMTHEQYGKRPVERLLEANLLDSDLIAIHMTQVSDSDLELLQKHQPSIIHCPESNMKLASGACDVDRLLKHNINVALGTDGAASNNDLDMISEMRTAAFLGKLSTGNPCAMPATTSLQMATINGAKALGIETETGSLKAGKSADFIAINLNEIETQPLFNPISQIVYAASRHQVTDTWVKGKQLMQNRKLLTLDENAILQKAKSWSEKISQG